MFDCPCNEVPLRDLHGSHSDGIPEDPNKLAVLPDIGVGQMDPWLVILEYVTNILEFGAGQHQN